MGKALIVKNGAALNEFDEDGDKEFKLPSHISLNKKLYRSAMSYHSIMIRLWSRIMYIIH